MRKALMLMLVAHASWLAWSATLQSPTLNEPGHLAAGLAIGELGRFDVYRVNPPLTKLVAAAPVIIVGGCRDWKALSGAPGSRSEFELGRAFIHANKEGSLPLFVLARWACIPFSLLGAFACYAWGTALYGPRAGFVAATLWCIDPNIVAHGQVITPDIASASLGLAASYAFWKWLTHPSWQKAVLAGALLGIAELTKLSWLMLFGLWPFLWTAHAAIRWRRSREQECVDAQPTDALSVRRECAQLLLQLAIAIYVVNLGYGFDGTGMRLGEFRFISRTFSGQDYSTSGPGNRFKGNWSGALPVPFPLQFMYGLDHQKRDFESFPLKSYLRGEWKHGGWWYYYLYAMAVKMPLGTICLISLAVILSFLEPLRRRTPSSPPEPSRAGKTKAFWGKATLAAPAIGVFLLASVHTEFNHHFRYVLPIMGPLFVLGGSVAARIPRQHGKKKRALAAAMAVFIAWTGISSVWHGASSLSYFNELVGGPDGGRFHLLHSNLDWGQDLLRLKAWHASHPEIPSLRIAYCGLYDPADLGLRVQPLQGQEGKPNAPFRPPAGWYAISVNYLMGAEWPAQPLDCSRFQELTPFTFCGSSIAIYDVHK